MGNGLAPLVIVDTFVELVDWATTVVAAKDRQMTFMDMMSLR
jgi:hypothetical protein